jgi:hypothetical protein
MASSNSTTISVLDFLEMVKCCGDEMQPIVGHRVQGLEDPMWTRQVEACRSAWRPMEACVNAPLPRAPLLLAIAACEDEYLPPRADADSLVAKWIDTRLKPRYQGLRLDGKRPWPEFFAAIKTGSGVTHADVNALMLVANAPVAREADGDVIVADALLDEPLDTSVIGTEGERTTLGTLARVAFSKRAGAPLVATCRSLALSPLGPLSVILSRIASRITELARVTGGVNVAAALSA